MTIPRARDGWDRRALGAVLALTAFAAFGRFPWLTAEDLWFDEVFSVVLASQDLGELLRRAVADQTNPPGFYLLLWGWVRLGSVDEGWIRALPALAGTLTVPAIVALGRSVGLRWSAALLGGLLAAVSPLLLAMSLEVRAYAPLALLSAISLALASRLASAERAQSPRLRVTLAAVDVGLVMLHYFGALVVLARVVAASLAARGAMREEGRRVRRDALLTALPAALAILLWLAVVILLAPGDRVGGNAAWIPLPNAAAVLAFGSTLIGSFDITIGVLGVGVLFLIAFAVALVAASRSKQAPWLLVAALLPLALTFVAGAVSGRSLWVARYLIIVLPALLLLVAALPSTLPRGWRTPALVGLAGWACLAGFFDTRTRQAKPAWSRIVPSLATGGPTTICVNEPFVGLPLQYHAIRRIVALTVQEMAACVASRTADWVMYRPGTESSLEAIRGAGGALGGARALGTELPPVVLRRLEWPQ